MIIGLSGKKRHGKDTVGRALIGMYGFDRLSFAEPLYELTYSINPVVDPKAGYELGRLQHIVDEHGWEKAKDKYEEVRRLLQEVGTNARNIIGEDVWVNIAMQRVRPGRITVFTDVRFPNEYQAVKDAGGEMWRIKRFGVPSNDKHISETALDDHEFDIVIENNSTLAYLEHLTAMAWMGPEQSA